MIGISLVVASYGRSTELRAFLDSVLAQGEAGVEVIVVDQNADDRVADILRHHACPARHLRLARPNASAARNAGAQAATHDWIGFPDDDCRLLPGMIAALRAAIDRSGMPIVSGLTMDEAGRPNILRWRAAAGAYTAATMWRCMTESTLFLRRDLFLASGGFDPEFGPAATYPAAEAAELLVRIFASPQPPQAWFSPDIMLYHPTKIPPWTQEAARRVYDYAKGEGALLAKHPLPAVIGRSLRFLMKHGLAGLLPGMRAFCSRRKLAGFFDGFRGYRVARKSLSESVQRLRALKDLAALLGPRPPTDVLDRLRRGDDSFSRVVALAVRHQLRGVLWRSLARHGLVMPLPPALRSSLPADHAALVLEEGRRFESEQAERTLAQCRQAIALLNEAGIEPMPLKGAALQMSGPLPETALRWMCDIDLLVPPGRMEAANAALLAQGYRPAGPAAAHHAAPLVPAEGGAEVELHADMVTPALQPALPTDRVWQAAQPQHRDGLRYFLPGEEDALLHVILHAQEGENSYGLARIPLRRFVDYLFLVERQRGSIDWERLAARAAEARKRRLLEAHLLQAERLFGLPWPLRSAPGLAARLHWRLCLRAAAYPESTGALLVGLLELRQVFARAGGGLSGLRLLAAWFGLAWSLVRKYRGRMWGRLLRAHRAGG